MAKEALVAGTTSYVCEVFVQDNTKTDGSGLTGLAFNSASLTAYYKRSNGTAAVAITLATITTLGTFASGGFKEVDAVHMPGVYEFDPPDAALASGAKNVVIMFQGAASMAPTLLEFELTANNNQDGVAGGMTALPNAAAGAANGLVILGANAQAISFTAGVTISNASGDALTISSGGGNGRGINVSGNGSGDAIKATGGATGNGMTLVGGATSGHGLAVTTTVGDGFNIAPTAGNGVTITANGTSKHGMVVTGGTAGTSDGIKVVAGAGGVDIRGAITGSITGNLSGSVASVTARVTANSDQIAGDGTAATNLSKGADGLVAGTCATGATTTVIPTNLSQTVTDLFKGRAFTLIGGTNAGAVATITGYNGGTKTLTVSPALAGAPANTDAFVIS